MSKSNFAESTGPDDAVALDQSKLTGLCLTCNHAQTCVRVAHHGQPVWFCEEFDDYTPPVAKSTGAGWKVIDDANSLASGDKENTRPVSGLCVNCATRGSCAFSESGTDIWECNEYS